MKDCVKMLEIPGIILQSLQHPWIEIKGVARFW